MSWFLNDTFSEEDDEDDDEAVNASETEVEEPAAPLSNLAATEKLTSPSKLKDAGVTKLQAEPATGRHD